MRDFTDICKFLLHLYDSTLELIIKKFLMPVEYHRTCIRYRHRCRSYNLYVQDLILPDSYWIRSVQDN